MRLADAPDALTVPDTAKVLNIGVKQAYAAVERGEIPSFRIGRTIRVSKIALEQLLMGGTPVATTGAPNDVLTWPGAEVSDGS
jgi:excisionase family DNA binding protein